MLTTDIQPGVLLVGLGPLINGGKPGIDGHYRVVRIGPQVVIEFFDTVPGGPGEFPVKILPYRTNEINSMTVGNVECISGEFTGCVMTLYRQDSAVKAGHVDTNSDTSQRAVYDRMKQTGAITVLDEYDTTAKLQQYPQLTGATRILCVASGRTVIHYFVDKETHNYSGNIPVPGEKGKVQFGLKSETRYRVLHAHGI